MYDFLKNFPDYRQDNYRSIVLGFWDQLFYMSALYSALYYKF